MTPVVGAFAEAWGEVRVHRARVVLSLVGVVLAVFAMTIITAAGSVARQVVLESGERSAGRTATLQVYVDPVDAGRPLAQTTRALGGLVDRFGVKYSSLVVQTQLQRGPLPQGGAAAVGAGAGGESGFVEFPYVDLLLVEPDYAAIHRLDPVAGRWLQGGDARRLAPAAVVNATLLEAAGMVGRQPPFSLPLTGTGPTPVVVGVVDSNPYTSQMIMLVEAAPLFDAQVLQQLPQLELWVPPEAADSIVAEIPAVLAQQGMQGSANVTSDPGLPGLISKAQWAVRGLSLFALALGTLGVLNVGIVTVRQRIREIGVRRALGASTGRVFAAIVLESVCATALAGAVGVALAVALVVNLPLETLLQDADIADVPGFPVSAAIEAFLAAVAVGALAGLVPATIAVRSRVIDAIRY